MPVSLDDLLSVKHRADQVPHVVQLSRFLELGNGIAPDLPALRGEKNTSECLFEDFFWTKVERILVFHGKKIPRLETLLP